MNPSRDELLKTYRTTLAFAKALEHQLGLPTAFKSHTKKREEREHANTKAGRNPLSNR